MARAYALPIRLSNRYRPEVGLEELFLRTDGYLDWVEGLREHAGEAESHWHDAKRLAASDPVVAARVRDGFALRWNGQEHGVLWISGDTVLYDGVRRVAERFQVNIALLHLGGVQFPITGPARYTMTAKDAVELCGLIRPSTAIPIHYEGWKHFKEGRDAIEGELAHAPEDIRERFRWVRMGKAVELIA